MIKKTSAIDRIEILADGQMQIRRRDSIMENGKEIAKTFHRHAIQPGSDTKGQAPRVRAVAKAIWTPAVVKAFKAAEAERKKQ